MTFFQLGLERCCFKITSARLPIRKKQLRGCRNASRGWCPSCMDERSPSAFHASILSYCYYRPQCLVRLWMMLKNVYCLPIGLFFLLVLSTRSATIGLDIIGPSVILAETSQSTIVQGLRCSLGAKPLIFRVDCLYGHASGILPDSLDRRVACLFRTMV